MSNLECSHSDECLTAWFKAILTGICVRHGNVVRDKIGRKIAYLQQKLKTFCLRLHCYRQIIDFVLRFDFF